MAKKKKVMAKPKAIKKEESHGLKLLNLKISGKDRKSLMAKAKKYAGGNLSAWLRYAGSKYVPPKNVVIR